ncbi:MAG: peptide-methionine (S)-S-oxide reductase MsrA [Anaerolineaceae bacterium]
MEKQALFAGGCFWGVEAKFQTLPGVLQTQVGYAGGSTEKPCYREVCQDTTGHAETVMIIYDPDQISYQQLLEAFFEFHDPTMCDCHAGDFGSQYRSVVFYSCEEEKETAEQVIAFLDVSGIYDHGILTQVVPAGPFYPAEEYHQQYYKKHGL